MFYQQNLLNKVIEENPEIISTSLACLSDSSSVVLCKIDPRETFGIMLILNFHFPNLVLSS